MPTATPRIMRSLSVAVHAEPRTPEITTYPTSATDPAHTAWAGRMRPYDAPETLMPSPLSWSTRYGTRAATLTSDTSTPSARLSYLATKKSAWDTRRLRRA